MGGTRFGATSIAGSISVSGEEHCGLYGASWGTRTPMLGGIFEELRDEPNDDAVENIKVANGKALKKQDVE